MAQKCVGVATITPLTASTGLGTIPAGTKYAVVQADGQAVRYWQNGTDPTSTTGVLLAAGASVTVTGNLANFRGIQVTAGAALQVEFFSS